MSFIVEIAFRFLFEIVAEFVLAFVANFLFFYFRRTGDFLIELVTLDLFRDHSKVPMHKAPKPVEEWDAALLGFAFWCAFAVAAYLSWPWLSSW